MRALAGMASRYSLMALSASEMAFGSPLAISLRRIPEQVSKFGIRQIYAAGIELGHSQNQFRTQGVKYGQHPVTHRNRLATLEPYLNSADANPMSVEGQKRRLDHRPVTSGVPPTQDISLHRANCRDGPLNESASR
jgi:hypothetical protein